MLYDNFKRKILQIMGFIKKIKRKLRNILNLFLSRVEILTNKEIKPVEIYNKDFDLRNINILVIDYCNNSCKFCSTSSPFAKKICHSAEVFYPWIDLLIHENILFSNISVTGGEPFLHHDIFTLLSDLRIRYPEKKIGITTNFYWANEETIEKYSSLFNEMLDNIFISIYPNIVKKLGGINQVNHLVTLLREHCPNINIITSDTSFFVSWKMHNYKQKVRKHCITSNCYVLRSNGTMSHCSIGAGLENKPEYDTIINNTTERTYDLNIGIKGLLSWAQKYPFDLCYHCTFWHKSIVKWQIEKKK